MLSETLGEAKRNVRMALAALQDAAKESRQPMRDDLLTIHDQISNWALEFFNTQAEIAAHLYDGKLPSFQALKASRRSVAALADSGHIRNALLLIDQALMLLTEEASLGSPYQVYK